MVQLSKRELEIVKLKSEGLVNKEVGVKLGISRRTVETHLSRVMLKFDCTSTIQLVCKLKDLKII